jgi:hypothetical protein
MRQHVLTVRALGSDGREYALRVYEAVPAGRTTPGDQDDRPGMSVLETSDGLAVSVGAAGELTIDATGVTLKLSGGSGQASAGAPPDTSRLRPSGH